MLEVGSPRQAGRQEPSSSDAREEQNGLLLLGAGLGAKEGRHDLAGAAAAMQPAAAGGGRCLGWSLLPLLELSSAVRAALSAS